MVDGLKIKIIVTIIAFVLISLFLFLSNMSKINKINKGKKKKGKEIKYIEPQYLFYKYKIAKKRLYTNKFAFLFAIINAAIICVTFFVIDIIPWHFAFQILIGFVLLMGLIYSIYGIIGSILVKRGYQDEL